MHNKIMPFNCSLIAENQHFVIKLPKNLKKYLISSVADYDVNYVAFAVDYL